MTARLWADAARRGLRVDPRALLAARSTTGATLARARRVLGEDVTDDRTARRVLDHHGISLPGGTIRQQDWPAAVVPPEAAEVWEPWRAAREAMTARGQMLGPRGIIAMLGHDGRIRPRVTVARTGRIQTSGPNAQGTHRDLRAVYVADHGALVSADWSSAEVRVAAALSEDDRLIADLVAGDPYARLADDLGVNRPAAKIVLAGVLHGAGPRALAKALGADRAEAVDILDGLWERYPDLGRWLDSAEGADLVTPHRRHIDPGESTYADGGDVIQACVADLLATVTPAAAEVAEEVGGSLWLPMHDEIIIDVPAAAAEDAAVWLAEAMTTALGDVPIPACPTIHGPNWSAK